MRIAACTWTSRFAAFLAVALLSFAGVKSAVMQVQMAGPQATDCGMGGMAMAGMAPRHDEAAAKAPKPAGATQPCAFCVDASAPPLIAWVEPLRPPSSSDFVPAPARPPLGARASPSLQPRARGPPSALQTA